METDFTQVVDFVDRAVIAAAEIASKVQGTKFKDFQQAIGPDGGNFDIIQNLKAEVVQFSRKYPTIGFDAEKMKYK